MERNLFRQQFDFEEDDYDKWSRMTRKKKKDDCFTNKSTKRKPEFDYEEDPYEP